MVCESSMLEARVVAFLQKLLASESHESSVQKIQLTLRDVSNQLGEYNVSRMRILNVELDERVSNFQKVVFEMPQISSIIVLYGYASTLSYKSGPSPKRPSQESHWWREVIQYSGP